MAMETLIVGGAALAMGLFTGILFSKLLLALVLRIINVEVDFQFSISTVGLLETIGLFLLIYGIGLLYNLGRVHLSNPIALLNSSKMGEREPKTKGVIAFISLVLLATGYGIAQSVDDPISALLWFFVAVLLVIAGTYGLMTTGSIVLLKGLRKNKNYYYKINHFISVSSMMYRMKQNAVGLASICILSTMVLVIVSTTTSLYMGMGEATKDASPRDIQIQGDSLSQEDVAKISNTVEQFFSKEFVDPEHILQYRFWETEMNLDGTSFSETTFDNLKDTPDARALFIPLEDYNKRTGQNIELAAGEALLFTKNTTYTKKTANFSGIEYELTQGAEDPLFQVPNEQYIGIPLYFVIVPDETAITELVNAGARSDKEEELYSEDVTDYYFGFDVNQDKTDLEQLINQLEKDISSLSFQQNGFAYVSSTIDFEEDFLSIYGGLYFVGIFLGIMFTLATVLIMYYKQISEGYDDRTRFEIMQKVGMDAGMIQGIIRAQVLTVFFLPLLVACIHIAFAFHMITKLLEVGLRRNLSNTFGRSYAF